jgi:hypothetical protein
MHSCFQILLRGVLGVVRKSMRSSIFVFYCLFFDQIFQSLLRGYMRCPLSIDAHGLKIQGEGPWGFCQILGGRVYRGLWKLWGEGTPFWCFIAFLLTSLAKISEGGYNFIPPHPPPPCVYQWECPTLCLRKRMQYGRFGHTPKRIKKIIFSDYMGVKSNDDQELWESLYEIVKDYSEIASIQGLNYIFFPYQVFVVIQWKPFNAIT